MDDLTDHLPAVIVVLRHPRHALSWYLTSTGVSTIRGRATRYATHSAARKAMRQARRPAPRDLDPHPSTR